MADNADESLTFADEEPAADNGDCYTESTWKVLIIDDEEEVHAVTKMVLSDFEYAGKKLEFISAYSGAEALDILKSTPEIAVALVDVVMEEAHAGLDVVKFIREELKDEFVRIILRTGQPGHAPERQVVQNYDINDYKEKTELTAQKLFSAVYTALGNYRALIGLEANRRGLIKVIEATADIFQQKSLQHFIQGVLEQITALLFLNRESVFVQNIGVSSHPQENRQIILAATGEDAVYIGQDPRAVLPPGVNKRIQKALTEHATQMSEHCFTGYFPTTHLAEAIIYVSSTEPLAPPDHNLLEIFFRNVTIGLENLQLKHEIEDTQREIVYLLSDAVETRSNETANHVRRVAEIAKMLGKLAGLDDESVQNLHTAAPLHDIGKIGIPDSILNKPDRLTDSEWKVMKTHARQGAKILGQSKRPVLQAAAILAEQHHENWDGSGYPAGLKGEEIHIYGRIISIADVYDALCSNRCYKSAWQLDAVIEYLQDQSGQKFDPGLVKLFIDNLDRFTGIREQYPDKE